MFLNGKNLMFSRAGLMSTEKYHILRRKDEILNGKKRIISKSVFENDKVKKVYQLLGFGR